MLNGVLADGVSLTTAYANSATTKINGNLQHVIRVFWTPGTASNVLSVDVQTRCMINGTATAWTSDMEWSAAAGTKTKTDNTYAQTAAGTTEIGLTILVPAGGDELRVRYKETEDGSATKGTIKVKAYSLNV